MNISATGLPESKVSELDFFPQFVKNESDAYKGSKEETRKTAEKEKEKDKNGIRLVFFSEQCLRSSCVCLSVLAEQIVKS